jgi:hypothetical protein
VKEGESEVEKNHLNEGDLKLFTNFSMHQICVVLCMYACMVGFMYECLHVCEVEIKNVVLQ